MKQYCRQAGNCSLLKFAALGVIALLGLGPMGMTFAANKVATTAPELLDADEAFQVSARMKDAHAIELSYTIAEGYYMYRGRFKFAAENNSATLKKAVIPAGKVKQDATFGRVETYRKSVRVLLPFANVDKIMPIGDDGFIRIKVTSQGCADAGVCYPPQHHQFVLDPGLRNSVKPVVLPTPNLTVPAGIQPATSMSDLLRKGQ